MSNLFNLLSAMCGKIKKADLSQNDPEAADYVKGVIRQESLPEGYPYKTETENVIFPETEFTTIDNDGTYMANSEATGELIIGNTYNVTLNGDKYTCVAYDANVAPAIGNGKLIGGDDTGEPFFFAFTKGMAVLFTESADTYIISVKETADSYSKIDENYLPDSVAGSPIEFVVSEDGTSVSCDLSSEELLRLSVHDLQKRCILVDGGIKVKPQSITTGMGTSSFGVHTSIMFVASSCGKSAGHPENPVYVVIAENGEIAYVTGNAFRVADIVRTASPGQTIVVKAVDDTGKPTEWEAVDMPSGSGEYLPVFVYGTYLYKDEELTEKYTYEEFIEAFFKGPMLIANGFVFYAGYMIKQPGDYAELICFDVGSSGVEAKSFYTAEYVER